MRLTMFRPVPLMVFLLFAIVVFILAGCVSTPRIYKSDQVTCTWSSVEELVVCKGPPIAQ